MVSEPLRFERDPRKAAANLKKHGVSFDEAETVFADEDALMIDDPDHADNEARFVLLGLSSRARTLVVCHCCREHRELEDVIRIFSARKANAHERRLYSARWKR